MRIVTEQALTDAEILKQSSLKLPKNLSELSRTDAQAVLAPYLVQGLNPAGTQIRAEFDAEADAIADRAGAASISDLVGRMLPAKKVTTEALRQHPEWVLLIGRYGDAAQIRHLKSINRRLDRSGWKGGSRLRNEWLGNLIDEAMAMSGQLDAAMYGSSEVRSEWIRRHIFDSPYHSCIPEGALIGPNGDGSVTTDCGPVKLSITPEFRLRYTDPGSGKKMGREPTCLQVTPGWPRAEVAELRRYLSLLQSDLEALLYSMYLQGGSMAASSLPSIAADPLLARYFRYVVFRQADTDFMLTSSGFVTAEGTDYAPSPHGFVTVPHPLVMNENMRVAFRTISKQGSAIVPQLREPIYDISNLPLKMFSVMGWWEARIERATLYVNGQILLRGARSVCQKYLWAKGHYYIPMRPGDPILNHALYQVDRKSASARIKLDDIQLAPHLLQIMGPKRALQTAIKAGAVKLTAVLLEEVNKERKKHSEVEDFRL